MRDRGQRFRAAGVAQDQCKPRGAKTVNGTGEPNTRILYWRDRETAKAYESAEPRDEHWWIGWDSIVPERQHVSHFVNVNGEHDAEREGPSVKRPIDPGES